MHDRLSRISPISVANRLSAFPANIIRIATLTGIAVGVFLTAAVSHMSALGNRYVLDDFIVIVCNRFIAQWENVKILFDPQYFFVPYPMRCGARPMTLLSLMIDHRLWDYNPFGYHLTSILCHGANAAGVFLLVSLLLKQLKDTRFGIAVFAALLFALHPLQVEAVDIASFRADLLVAFFYVVALLLFIKAQEARRKLRTVLFYTLAVLSFVCALLSKELAITLPLVLLLYFLVFNGRRALSWRIIGASVTAGIIAAFFFLVFWRARFTYVLYEAIFPNIQDNVSPISSLPAYINTLVSTILHYAATLLYPAHLSIDYLVKSGPALLYGRLAVVLALFALLALIFRYSNDKLLKFGIGLFLVTYLPVSNLVPLINTVNDRYMYLPMAGFSLAVSSLIHRLPEGRFGSVLSLRLMLMGALLACCGWLTMQRNFVFEDGYSLYRDGMTRAPDNVRIRYNLGVAYMTRQRYADAIVEFKNVSRINPFFKKDDLWYLMGTCYEQLGDHVQAKTYYSRVLRLVAKKEALQAYAELLRREGNINDAIPLLEISSELYPDDAITFNNLGVFYVQKDDLPKAIACFRTAVDLAPGFIGAWENLIDTCRKKGDDSLAVRESYRMIALLSKKGAYIRRKSAKGNILDGSGILMLPAK